MLLPLVGMFGWITGAAYPYYRFMNATVALFALGGLGAYVAIKWLWKRDGLAKIAGVVASLVIVGSFGYIWLSGRESSNWATRTASGSTSRPARPLRRRTRSSRTRPRTRRLCSS